MFTYCTKATRKEAIWVVSNISAKSEADAIAVAKHSSLVNLLYACRDNSFDIRKEAIWALSNILYQVNDKETIESLVTMDVVGILIDRLQRDYDSGSICSLSLQSVDYLLQKSVNARDIFDRFGGESVVQDLQLSEFHEVYQFAQTILEKHFGAQEMDEDEKKQFIKNRDAAVNNKKPAFVI